MSDPRASGVPDIGGLEASLQSDGSLSEVEVTVAAPDGDIQTHITCTFYVDEGVATLHKVEKADLSTNPRRSKELETFYVGTHLPGILAAEMAVEDLEQIRDVRGLMGGLLLDDAETQALQGWRFQCPGCEEECWGSQAAETDGPKGLSGGLYCPHCEEEHLTDRDLIERQR